MNEYIKRVEKAITVKELSKVLSDFSRDVASGVLRDNEGFRAIIGRKIDAMAK
jgi:phosphotransferase system IIB component